MRKMSTSLIGLTTALTLTVVACGDDVTGVTSGDELTSTEVAAVLTALGSAFESVGAGAQAAPGQVPISFNESFSLSAACESGTIDVSGSIAGTVDDVTFDSDTRTTVRWELNDCVVSDGTNTFTVNGAPHIELVLDLITTQDDFTATGTQSGGFSFTSSDGRTGSCSMDVTFSIVTTATSVDATVTGTICGQNASGFETLGG